MRKKLFTLLFAVVANVGSLFAESGTCGDNLTWFLNTEDSTLTIIGTGEMYDYMQTEMIKYSSAPWSTYMDDIRKIIVSEGVTYIGDYAFQSCNLDSLIIPSSIKTIGKGIIDGLYVPSEPFLYTYSRIKVLKWEAISVSCSKSRVTYFDNNGLPAGDHVITPLYEGPYGTMGNPIINIVEIGKNVKYLPNYLFAGVHVTNQISISCAVSYEKHTFANCDYDVVGSTSYTQLPDTTICYGGWIYDNGTDIRYRYLSEDGHTPYAYENPCGEPCAYCDIAWNMGLQIVDSSACPEGVDCCEYYPNGQQFYSSRVYTRTYTNSQGCDSVVTRNINVIRSIAPHIEVSPEQDTFNSGKIKIYDVYCTDSRYVGCNERDCDPYEYTYAYAKYDYITINGVVYNYASKSDSIVSFKDNGYKNRGNVNNPDYLIENLPAGEYHIVFYSSCDSIAQDITIESKGIEIDGIYYKYVPEDYRNEGLKVTYRGTSPDEYDEYFGDIVIPDSAIYNGKKLPVRYIDMVAFEYCSNISSISFKNPTPPCDEYGSPLILYIMQSKLVIYVPFGALDAYKSYIQCNYFNYDYTHYYRYISYYFPVVHVIHPQNVTIETSSTTSVITIGNADYTKHISSCGIIDEEEYPANVIVYSGLDPNTEYTDIALYVKTIEGDYDTIHCSFTTPTLELTTQPSKPVSSTTAILLAETNMSDAEVNCGFEYKRNDAPADMSGTKVYCPVANGQMAGRLKNLKDDVYYKYRAFYQSTAGNTYYGDWQYIFTGDLAVEFDPILYTYGATVVQENEATISGYALAGSEDFTEQGFEYWAESRANGGASAPHRMAATIGEHKYVHASGIKMSVTLTDLDEGTVYKYRAYGKTGNQFFYGSEQTFTTPGAYQGSETGIDEVPSDQVQNTKAQKILRKGQIYILYNGTMYNIQGQKVK